MLEKYLKYLKFQKDCSENTISAYRRDILSLLNFCNKKIEEISLQDCKEWIIKMRQDNISKRSITRKISSVKSFVRYLEDFDLLKDSEILNLKGLKFDKTLPKAIDKDWIFKMISEIDSLEKLEIWEKSRDKLILLTIFLTGMRISEVLSIRISDVNQGNGMLKILGKGNKERLIPITNFLKKAVLEYIQNIDFLIKKLNFKDNDYLFFNKKGKVISPRNVQLLFEKLRRKCNLPEYITPHVLRHSCATELLNEGLNIIEIQKLLGHSNLETTQIYTKVSKEHLAKKLEECLGNY